MHGNFCRRQADLQKDRQELSDERQQGVQLREKLRLLRGTSVDFGLGSACALAGKISGRVSGEAPETTRGGACALRFLQLIFVTDRAGAGDVFLDRLRIARIRNFARAGNRDFQRLANRKLGVSCAGRGDFDGFRLKTIRG